MSNTVLREIGGVVTVPTTSQRTSRPRQRTNAVNTATATYTAHRGRQPMPQDDIQLAKANVKSSVKRAGKKPAKKSKTTKKRKASAAIPAAPVIEPKKQKGLANLLSPKGIQDTLKSVGSLRTSVKQWMGYLQQADQILDTIFITSTSLKETGVLEKLIKQKGKNLSTEDFTNILIALMNTPVGGQLFKSMAGSESSIDTPNPQ